MGVDGAEDDEFAEISDGMSDDDFDALRAVKPEGKEPSNASSKESSKESSRGPSRAPSEQPANGRTKRAAAAAPKKWVITDDEESESDDGKFLGDVGAMVKGIGGGDNGSDRSCRER